ncbi:MAG: hypothetical protein ACAI37_28435 [Chthoniobacter sp.]
MKTSLKSAVALIVLPLVLSITTSAADVEGTYKCEGDNQRGGKYTGTVTIAKQNQTYRVVWKLAPRETYFGLGVLQGDVLAVSYYESRLGVVAYKVEDDSKLVGKRAMVQGDGTVTTETLTR